MKENLVIFLTHFDDYLDVCIGLNDDPRFDSIRQAKYELKRKKLPTDEYVKAEAEIFYAYLVLIGVNV